MPDQIASKRNQSSFTREELLACASSQLFNSNSAQLPDGQMLMRDRVTHISSTGGAFGMGEVVAEFDIHPDLWFFGCHFIGDPVMPGCLGLDALWQLTGFFLTWRGNDGHGRALGSKEVKFFGQVLPTAKVLTYRLDISRVVERKLVMAIADGSVSVDGQEIYTAKGLRVGVFQSTDNF